MSSRKATFLIAGGALTFASSVAQAGITYSGVLNTSVSSVNTLNVDFDGGGNDAEFNLLMDKVLLQQLQPAWEYMHDAGDPVFGAFGDTIGGASTYSGLSHSLVYFLITDWKGPYGSANLNTPGYLGWRIDTGSGYKYGWAQITVNGLGLGGYTSVLLKDYAYENLLDTPITAGDTGVSAVPEPSTFALLAAGVAGLAALRRRKRNHTGSAC